MGADIDAPIDSGGSTMLMNAALRGQRQTMDLLLQHGASVEAQKAVDGCTALLCAIQGVDVRASERGESAVDTWPIARLLRAGADPDQRCQKGSAHAVTPLLFATQLGSTPIAELLLRSKASPDLDDDMVPKPLIVACANRNVRVARLLLQHGAVLEPPGVGATPCSRQIRTPHIDVGSAALESFEARTTPPCARQTTSRQCASGASRSTLGLTAHAALRRPAACG